MSRLGKGVLAFVLAVLAAVIAGYIVALLKGVSPDTIAAFLWSPFGAAFGWINAPARVTHGEVVVFISVLFAFMYQLHSSIQKSEEGADQQAPESDASENAVPQTFALAPPDVRAAAISVLLNRYPSWTALDDLHQRMTEMKNLELPLGAKAHISREMEIAEKASVVTIDVVLGYKLTPQGRNWMLDKIAEYKAQKEAKQP